jgi:hypothetical protein
VLEEKQTYDGPVANIVKIRFSCGIICPHEKNEIRDESTFLLTRSDVKESTCQEKHLHIYFFGKLIQLSRELLKIQTGRSVPPASTVDLARFTTSENEF